MAVPTIGRTAIMDDDGTRSTGTIINNTWKTEFYGQIDALIAVLYKEGSWTPVLKFGGASVGITYTTQSGVYRQVGNAVLAACSITLSAKGSSTGAVTITGLPVAVGALEHTTKAFTVSVGAVDDIAFAYVAPGATSVQLLKNTDASAITDTSFGATSRVLFTLAYFL